MSRKYRVNRILYAIHTQPPPLSTACTTVVHLLPIYESTLTHCYLLESIVYISNHSVVHSVVLMNACSDIHSMVQSSESIARNSLTTLKILCALLIPSSLSLPTSSHLIFLLSPKYLPFPEYHILRSYIL